MSMVSIVIGLAGAVPPAVRATTHLSVWLWSVAVLLAI